MQSLRVPNTLEIRLVRIERASMILMKKIIHNRRAVQLRFQRNRLSLLVALTILSGTLNWEAYVKKENNVVSPVFKAH